MGMAEETRQHCLNAFYTTKGKRGIGLGLAMVYGTIQRYAAQINIESEIGQGTTVSLFFPRNSGQEQTKGETVTVKTRLLNKPPKIEDFRNALAAVTR